MKLRKLFTREILIRLTEEESSFAATVQYCGLFSKSREFPVHGRSSVTRMQVPVPEHRERPDPGK